MKITAKQFRDIGVEVASCIPDRAWIPADAIHIRQASRIGGLGLGGGEIGNFNYSDAKIYLTEYFVWEKSQADEIVRLLDKIAKK